MFLDRHPYLLNKYEFVFSKKPHVRFISVFGDKFGEFNVPANDCVNVFYTGENVEPDMKLCDYAISFSLNDSQNHYRLPCWVPRLYQNGMRPMDLLSNNRGKTSYEVYQKYFCNFIYKNKVDFRESFFHKLNRLKSVSSPGASCKNMPGIGITVKDKINYQRRFRFSVAMENECYPGYVTEKIVEAFMAGTVPIYMGDSTIGNDFNLESFVFIESIAQYDEAIERVFSIENNWSSYMSYRREPIYNNNIIPEYAVEDNVMTFFEKIFD